MQAEFVQYKRSAKAPMYFQHLRHPRSPGFVREIYWINFIRQERILMKAYQKRQWHSYPTASDVKLRRMAESMQQHNYTKIQQSKREANHRDNFRLCSKVSSGSKDKVRNKQEGWDRRKD